MVNRRCALLRRTFGVGRRHTLPLVRFVSFISRLKEQDVQKTFLEQASFWHYHKSFQMRSSQFLPLLPTPAANEKRSSRSTGCELTCIEESLVPKLGRQGTTSREISLWSQNSIAYWPGRKGCGTRNTLRVVRFTFAQTSGPVIVMELGMRLVRRQDQQTRMASEF